ncbi:MAG: hypothetical protein HYV02_02415 [Deltaproteobacteria bacterium]|nr:hypothetical protein [Deltaproteobacteria bacterium]
MNGREQKRGEERVTALRRHYQAVRRKYLEARRHEEAALERYGIERCRFIELFRRLRPKHARKIEETIAERQLPDAEEAFAVIAGILAIRRGPTEV